MATDRRVTTARSTKGVASYVSVRAAGISRVGGLVKVLSRGHVVARIPIVNGAGRAYVKRLPHGRSTIRFVYVANGQFDAHDDEGRRRPNTALTGARLIAVRVDDETR